MAEGISLSLQRAHAERDVAVSGGTCQKPPVGCGKVIEGFRDPLSVKEYRISGLCQACQDAIFEQGWDEPDYPF